jgi:deoxyribose-phosphate aldolase
MAQYSYLNNSQDDWAAIIKNAYEKLPSSFPTYKSPQPGSAEFAQLIDHTLLKLDATDSQIDKLCEEAKEYGFKVREYPITSYV